MHPCRLVGVSDLCDYPPEAASKTKVSHSCINSAEMTSAEVVALSIPSLPNGYCAKHQASTVCMTTHHDAVLKALCITALRSKLDDVYS